MNKVIFLIFSIILICGRDDLLRMPASNTHPEIDIVFDLDWTLVKQVDSIGVDPSKFLEVNGEFYRVGDGAVEVLEYLFSNDHVRVSFFSGGKYDRNSKLLKKIETKFGSAFDNAYKVLSYNDLLEVSTDQSLSFADRFKKDVSLINIDLRRVLIIDDDKRFVVREHKKNLLWMGETYKHFEQFSDIVDPLDQYSPKSRTSWNYDRKKLYMVKEILEESLEENEDFLDKVAFASKKWNFEKNIPTIDQRRILVTKFTSNSCSELMINFLTP